jgi:myo-inositol catabolism protein IolC
MTLGFNQPLYIMPFDHRASYLSGMFHFTAPLNPVQHEAVVASKRLIYDGFLEALGRGMSRSSGGILVDEEFGAAILRDATAAEILTAVSVEKSGSDEFEFEFGDAFAAHIATFTPTFAKVLVRYNPEGDSALNQRQKGRLTKLSRHCQGVHQRLMFELLVPATSEQLTRVKGDKAAFDAQVRPALMCQAIRDLQDADVEPDVWKIEGLNSRKDCQNVVEAARRDGRDDVRCIVLGRGADEQSVVGWLEVAASVPGFIGFAVGRTTFWDAVAGYVAKTVSRTVAVSRIADNYCRWVAIFEKARVSGAGQVPRGSGVPGPLS